VIDDRWEGEDSGYDPCDPRFDGKAIALRIYSASAVDVILHKNPEWQALLKGETPPIGFADVLQSVSPSVAGKFDRSPVECTICLQSADAERCAAFFVERPQAVQVTLHLALRQGDLLEPARKSAWTSRFLRDIDTNVARAFPVLSLNLEVQLPTGAELEANRTDLNFR
jgi:hypothetical protein